MSLHVVEPTTEVRLAELAEVIDREHRAAEEAWQSALEHATHCGEALLAARKLMQDGQWSTWLEASDFPFTTRTARQYMRLAEFRDQLDPTLSVQSNLRALVGQRVNRGAPQQVAQDVKDEAARLYEAGVTFHAIAKQLGVTPNSVRAWLDPAFAERKLAKWRERKAQAQRAEMEATAASEHGAHVLTTDAFQRARRHGEPGRAAIGLAVRCLAQAQGSVRTREALLDLAAIAEAWADRLGGVRSAEAEAA